MGRRSIGKAHCRVAPPLAARRGPERVGELVHLHCADAFIAFSASALVS